MKAFWWHHICQTELSNHVGIQHSDTQIKWADVSRQTFFEVDLWPLVVPHIGSAAVSRSRESVWHHRRKVDSQPWKVPKPPQPGWHILGDVARAKCGGWADLRVSDLVTHERGLPAGLPVHHLCVDILQPPPSPCNSTHQIYVFMHCRGTA